MYTNFVEIRVPQALHDYIVHTTGGNIIHLGKNGVLWAVVKQHLICYTAWKKEPSSRGMNNFFLRIPLLRKNGAQAHGRQLQLNTESRKFLSLSGERIVARLLTSEFNKTFIDYMCGAYAVDPNLNIKDIILKFCDDYGLIPDKSYEMLKKRWYRYRKKSSQHQNTLKNF